MQSNVEKLLKGRFLSKFKIVKYFFQNRLTPVTLEVHPSYACNYNCMWCIDKYLKNVPNEDGYKINRDDKTMLNRKNMDDILKGCEDLDIKGIILSGGGEPTLNKETEYLVEEANKRGIVVGMFTNGSMLNKENIPIYIGNLSFIRFSFDDYSARHYAKTKGVPERLYHKVLDNIKACTSWKKKHPETKCKIGIDFILTPDNVDRMVSIYLTTKNLGVDYLQFCDCVEQGYEFTSRIKAKILNSLENILSFKNYNPGECLELVYEPLQVANDTYCKDCEILDYFIQVGADGEVEPCPHLARHRELSYGNINERCLEDIWLNRPRRSNTKMFWENCRFREQNRILKALKHIEHEELL